MKTFQQHFAIHPVGQGLFYSGVHQYNEAAFRFVFDCGSYNSSNMEEEVNYFRQEYLNSNPILDLLIISHFHKDHVSHIGELLRDKRVNSIVMPFLHFKERVGLLLSHLYTGHLSLINRTTPDNFFLSLLIDPLSTLGSYLSGDGNIYIVESDNNNPPFRPTNNDENNYKESNERQGYNFEFERTVTISASTKKEFNTASDLSAKTVLDSSKGSVRYNQVRIMDFLFYRKQFSDHDESFYRQVYDSFCEHFELTEPGIGEINDIIVNIVDSKIIKAIFEAAANKLTSIELSHELVTNMNSTALCLLHVNNQDFNHSLTKQLREEEDSNFYIDFTLLQKLDGTRRTSYRTPSNAWPAVPVDYYLSDYLLPMAYPNVLLTSDGYFRGQHDVAALHHRYQNYWTDFWLFQVPHHGSRNNINLLLLSIIPHFSRLFVNYGVIKTWPFPGRHPHEEVIQEIVASGCSLRMLPVTEYVGLYYSFFNKVVR